MNEIAAIVKGFRRRGVLLQRVGDRLLYDAPKAELMPADLKVLKTHKAGILELLELNPNLGFPAGRLTPATLLTAANRVGVDVSINSETGKVEATVGPNTPAPFPSALMIEIVDRAAELQPHFEVAPIATPAKVTAA